MGAYLRNILFSLMFVSGFSYSESWDDYLFSGYSSHYGTHLAYTYFTWYGKMSRPATYINGSVYQYMGFDFPETGSFTNGYTEKGAFYTGKWLVLDSSVVYAEGLGDIYNYGRDHSQEFSRCYPVKPPFKYKFSDTYEVQANPQHPEYGTIPGLIYDGCSYVVKSNDCPDGDIFSDTICTATNIVLLSNKTEENDKPLTDGYDDNPESSGDTSTDSSPSDSSSGSSGSSGGSDGSSGGGPPVFPGGGSGTGSDSFSGDTDFGSGSGDSSGDSGSGGGFGGSGTSPGGIGSGGGSGSHPGSNPSGGSTGATTGATGDDEDGANIFLPSLDIPELSLAPLWNIWPSARDFVLQLPSARCPVWNFPLFGRVYQIDQFCTLFTPDLIAVIRVICLLTASVMSFFIVLRS
ncbi:hypothetical protein AH783_03795 [Salmonella enterica subsp. enterica serovar Rubislaw]|nr:hypothetical protein [Salmonella enterica subsp. enterica serovar Rubislaw]